MQAFIDMQPAVADVFATFIAIQKVCRDMQIAFTDAYIAFARAKMCHLSISATFACC